MSLFEELQRQRQDILALAQRYGASNVRVFGSVAREEEDLASDIDFVVNLEPGRSLLDLGGLLMDLRDLLGRRVDLVTEEGLRPTVKARLLKDARPL